MPRARRGTGDDLPPAASIRAQAGAGAGRPGQGAIRGERQAVLAELHCERFVDCSPVQVWATLLDEGRYLASERTMYRLLAAQNGGVGGDATSARTLATPSRSCSPSTRTRSGLGTSRS